MLLEHCAVLRMPSPRRHDFAVKGWQTVLQHQQQQKIVQTQQGWTPAHALVQVSLLATDVSVCPCLRPAPLSGTWAGGACLSQAGACLLWKCASVPETNESSNLLSSRPGMLDIAARVLHLRGPIAS